MVTMVMEMNTNYTKWSYHGHKQHHLLLAAFALILFALLGVSASSLVNTRQQQQQQQPQQHHSQNISRHTSKAYETNKIVARMARTHSTTLHNTIVNLNAIRLTEDDGGGDGGDEAVHKGVGQEKKSMLNGKVLFNFTSVLHALLLEDPSFSASPLSASASDVHDLDLNTIRLELLPIARNYINTNNKINSDNRRYMETGDETIREDENDEEKEKEKEKKEKDDADDDDEGEKKYFYISQMCLMLNTSLLGGRADALDRERLVDERLCTSSSSFSSSSSSSNPNNNNNDNNGADDGYCQIELKIAVYTRRRAITTAHTKSTMIKNKNENKSKSKMKMKKSLFKLLVLPVRILDVNDQAPTFKHAHYYLNISENLAGTTPQRPYVVPLEAPVDLDSSRDHAVQECELLPLLGEDHGDHGDHGDHDDHDDHDAMKKSESPLTWPFRVVYVAEKKLLFLHVLDVLDREKKNSYLLTLTCTDYSLNTSSSSSSLSSSSSTNEQWTAVNNGVKQKKKKQKKNANATTLLHISVLDANDNIPYFIKPIIYHHHSHSPHSPLNPLLVDDDVENTNLVSCVNVSVVENVAVHTLLRIRAIDADDPLTPNGQRDYSLPSELNTELVTRLFAIHPHTGDITVNNGYYGNHGNHGNEDKDKERDESSQRRASSSHQFD